MCVCECVEGSVSVCLCVYVSVGGWVHGMDMGVGVDRYSFGMRVYMHLFKHF